MGTQLIFTVGTNPLPVWVAWFHLKDVLKQPIQVRFIHTQGTQAEMQRLTNYCRGAGFLNPVQTSPGDPRAVRNDTAVILEALDQNTNLHIHYTGGTKVMSVETVAALEYDLPSCVELGTSYLDPRGNDGPTIVDSYGKILVPDTRVGADLELGNIAFLNGFDLGPFKHTYWDSKTGGNITDNCCGPKTLDQSEMNSGVQALQGRFIEEEDSHLLEYGAYHAFKNALDTISCQNSKRNNYKLFHNVYVRRSNATSRRVRPFELDVVAVLGYQIVVISCTLSSKPDRIKQKGMEAILRARQLGGDEARAIVLCSDQHNQRLIEAELQDETGSSDLPLQVWGKNNWCNLSNKFLRYLRNDLHWM